MNKKTRLLLVGFMTLMTACGQGLQSNTGTQTPNDNNGNSGNSGSADWEKVDFVGTANGGELDKKLVAFIDKTTKTLNLTIPLPVPVGTNPRLLIPGLSGAVASVVEQAGKQVLELKISLKYLLAGQIQGTKDRLPNGDKLPFVKGGELPRFAVALPGLSGHSLHVYLSEAVAAVFVELPDFGMPFGGTVPVSNKQLTKTLGAIGYLVPKDQSPGGMYLAAQLPPDVKAALEELLR